MSSSRRSCAAWCTHSGIAETREIGRIPLRTCDRGVVKYGIPGRFARRVGYEPLGDTGSGAEVRCAYLVLHRDVVGDDEARAVDEADFGCPEEGLKMFYLWG